MCCLLLVQYWIADVDVYSFLQLTSAGELLCTDPLLLQTCRHLTDRLVFLIGNNYIAACLVPVTMTCNHVLTVVTYGTCLCANIHLENAMHF